MANPLPRHSDSSRIGATGLNQKDAHAVYCHFYDYIILHYMTCIILHTNIHTYIPGTNKNVTFILFAELRPLRLYPTSTQIRATDWAGSNYLTTSLENYENPKLIAVWGITFVFILVLSQAAKSPQTLRDTLHMG